jgi:hypothetical protein
VGVVAIGTTFNGVGGGKFRFSATKVPRQCPFVLLVKVGLVKERRLEVEKVRWRVEQGENHYKDQLVKADYGNNLCLQ